VWLVGLGVYWWPVSGPAISVRAGFQASAREWVPGDVNNVQAASLPPSGSRLGTAEGWRRDDSVERPGTGPVSGRTSQVHVGTVSAAWRPAAAKFAWVKTWRGLLCV
jgi:hypothetical protein